jgi:hypothetical protein
MANLNSSSAAINGDYNYWIHKWNGSDWSIANGGAVCLSVTRQGVPWVINKDGEIYRKADASLTSPWIFSNGWARDIAIAPNGNVWVVGNIKDPNTNDYFLFKWNGSSWDQVPFGAVRIAVTSTGNPWGVKSNGDLIIKAEIGLGWYSAIGPEFVTDIGIGSNDTVWVIGNIKIPGTNDQYIQMARWW